MKQIFLLLIFTIGFLFNASAQVLIEDTSQSPQELYAYHFKKKNANSLAAWITLGGGVVMFIAGLGINTSQGFFDGDTTNNNEGLWLSYLGGAVTLTSIPLFIAKGKHKRKAEIQLKKGGFGITKGPSYSGISITFSL